MTIKKLRPATLPSALLAIAISLLAIATAHAASSTNGIVRVKSSFSAGETIERLKADIAKKGITFFAAIDQNELGAKAGIAINRSTLLLFGNPSLGLQFLASRPEAGLDWPVRLLVIEDKDHQVWAVYNDFDWIKRRHRIRDRDPQFQMATEVIRSITSSVTK
jgi:uncharacterized protein (DUF302 family)